MYGRSNVTIDVLLEIQRLILCGLLGLEDISYLG